MCCRASWSRESHLIRIRAERAAARCCCDLPLSRWSPDRSPGWSRSCRLRVFEWSQPARGGGAGGFLSLPKTTGAIQQGRTCLAPSKSMEIHAMGEPRVFQWTLRSFSGGGCIGHCCPGRKRRSGRSPLGQPSPGSAPPKGLAWVGESWVNQSTGAWIKSLLLDMKQFLYT